jgi:hypothetical protein
MKDPNGRERTKFEGPADYRIVVQGVLDKGFSERLFGLRITVSEQVGEGPVTTLRGWLRDQAELSGLLNTLYELHLPILSVEVVGRDKPD